MRRLCLGLALALASTGCSATVTAGPEPDAEASPAAALVVVERIVAADGVRTEARARFARGRGATLADETLRFVGLEPFPPPGTCSRVLSSAGAPAPVGGVRLLDVGRVTLAVDGAGYEPATFELARRRFPDVVDLVSGVVYSARLEAPRRATYEVRIAGEPELGPTRATLEASSDLSGLRIDGAEPVGTVAVGTEIALDWDRGSDRDMVAADLIAIDGDGRRGTVARCSFADAGRGTMPLGTFEGEGILAVRRSQRVSLRTGGVERGEFRFDVVRELPVARRR